MKRGAPITLLVTAAALWGIAVWVHWYGAETALAHSNAPRDLMLRVLSFAVPAGLFVFFSSLAAWRASWTPRVSLAALTLSAAFLAWSLWSFWPALRA